MFQKCALSRHNAAVYSELVSLTTDRKNVIVTTDLKNSLASLRELPLILCAFCLGGCFIYFCQVSGRPGFQALIRRLCKKISWHNCPLDLICEPTMDHTLCSKKSFCYNKEEMGALAYKRNTITPKRICNADFLPYIP